MTPRRAFPIDSPEGNDPHFGDLRKGAYLKRRAAYQLQASSGTTLQAGSLGLFRQATARAGSKD